MMLRLAFASLRNRFTAGVLTVAAVAVSVALLLSVEQMRTGLRESFTHTISGTDLIVGTRVGDLQLLLFTVFSMGGTPDNIDYETFERYRDHPAVAWAVPFSLGDSHRGFRVFATDQSYFQNIRHHQNQNLQFATGKAPRGSFEAVVGHSVAEKLGYKTGTKIVLSHGLSTQPAVNEHDEHPFIITGILDQTATPIDQSVFITLTGMDLIHGAVPAQATTGAHAAPPREITAFFLGLHSRIDTLRLQREINRDRSEPLLAILPGVALSNLWRGINKTDAGLKAISALVILVGLTSMLIALLGTLQERRREMAVLRAVGAGPSVVVTLLLLEAATLTLCGLLAGVCLNYAAQFAAQPMLESSLGLSLPIRAPSATEWLYLAVVWLAGLAMGLVPALNAYRNTLADGLSVTV